jgi:REP element-mobilizing transposase RayT
MSTGVFDKFAGFHNRRSLRLTGYDYSQPGGYFITIRTHDRIEPLFGDAIDGQMVENEFGEIVRHEWLKTAEILPNVFMDEFIVMPDHVHGIIIIRDRKNYGFCWGTLLRVPTRTKKPRTISETNVQIIYDD